MQLIYNTMRAIERTPSDKLNIMVFNDATENYVARLARTQHNFFLHEPSWNEHICQRPYNVGPFHNDKPLDFVISFDRGGNCDHALRYSNTNHVPLIMVDMTSSQSSVNIPFFTQVKIKSPEELMARCGIINIACNKHIERSWNNHFTSFTRTIPIPPIAFKPQNPSRILLDAGLPQQYAQTLPIAIDDKFTTNKNEACAYLHLWQSVTPLMLDCLASEIPVLTFKSHEFTDIEKGMAFVLMNSIQDLDAPNFLEQLMQFPSLDAIKQNAITYINNNNSITVDEFAYEWNKVFSYASSFHYDRG